MTSKADGSSEKRRTPSADRIPKVDDRSTGEAPAAQSDGGRTSAAPASTSGALGVIGVGDGPLGVNGKTLAAGTAKVEKAKTGPAEDEDAAVEEAYQNLELHRRQKKRRRRAKVIVAACVVAVVAAAIAVPRLLASGDEGVEPPATAEVTRGDLTSSVSVTGSAQPASSVYVTPEVDGIVQEVRVSEGDQVAAGDVLLTLKNDSLDRAVQDAQSQVDKAQRSVNTAYATYKKALDEWNAAPDGEAQSQMTDPDSLYGDVQSASEDLASAKQSLADAQAQAAKRTVTAPVAGSVVAVSAKPGASYGDVSGASTSDDSGQSQGSGSLVQIADLSSMRVSTQVNEVDISGVSVGQTAKVTFQAVPDLECDATVDHIATVSTGGADASGVEGGVVTYEVDLVIKSPDARIKPGMTANATIKTLDVPDVLMVPVSALNEYDESAGTATVTVVTLDEDGQVASSKERKVEVGEKNGSDAVVTGVEEGQTVLLADDSDSGSSDDAAEFDGAAYGG